MRSGKPDNPFIVQRLGPGGTDYIFAEGDSAAAWLDRLEQEGGMMELTGPHGAGKSTLLHAIGEEANQRGAAVSRLRFSDEQRRLPWGWKRVVQKSEILFVDGGERLSPLGRRRLIGFCRKRGIKIIATTHEPLNFGASHRIEASPIALAELTRRLLNGRDDLQPFSEEEGARLLKKYGSAREALFALYDAYEKDTLELLIGGGDDGV